MYSDDMQIIWDWLFLSLLYVAVTGRVLCTVPHFFWRAELGLRCETLNPTLTQVLEDFVIY